MHRGLKVALVTAGLALSSGFSALEAGDSVSFQRGDANADGRYDISDGIAILNWLFVGSSQVLCADAADPNDSGTNDLSDGVFIFLNLFSGGADPAAPFGVCGVDPTPDALGCEAYALCDQDNEPPIISGISILEVSQSTARLVFNTSERATVAVHYGLDASYGLDVGTDSVARSAHNLAFEGLSAGTTYHYEIEATDEAGNTASSGDRSFTTSPANTELTKIGHVLNRLAYGPTPGEVERVRQIGVASWINEQLSPETITENPELAAREAALFDDLILRNDTPIVRPNEVWRYFKGTSEPPAAWKNHGFVDTSWLLGATSIGYGDGDDLTVLEDMRQIADDPATTDVDESQPGYLSVYLRKVFFVADVSAIEDLILRVDYDDSFVAYLNGTEVARAGLSGSPPRFNTSGSSHESGEPVEFDITARRALLVDGENTLAVQVHNANLTSSDLTIRPELLSRELLDGPPRKVIGGVTDLQKLVHVRGVYSRKQLQTVLAEFWENHFTTDVEKVAEYFDALLNSDATDAMSAAQARAEAAQVEYEEYQFLHDNALGNFGDLLLFSATSPSMLIYLDSVLNVAGGANENYGREIYELSAFGVDNRYTQRDIEQISKCLTGWTVCKVDPGEKLSFPASATNPPNVCGVQFTDSVVLGLGAGWKYFKGTQEPSPGPGGAATTAWTQVDFNASTWLNGSTGIGYGDGDDATVLNDMQNNYTSVYLRREFTVADPVRDFDNLIAEIAYDDGYVMYLNGIEVGRSSNMEDEGSPPAFNETADETHEVDEAKGFHNLNAYLSLLRPAPAVNVLAIQMHNGSLGSSDLSCLPRLLDRTILPGSVEPGDPSGIWTFRFNPDQHDTSAKSIYVGTPFRVDIPAGRTGAAGLRDALDVIQAMVDHPSTAEFISIKLIQRFVSDEITLASFRDGSAPIELRELLADMVAAWNSTSPKGNIETVLRTLFDPEAQSGLFWQDMAYRTKVKTPIEYINSSLRVLEADADGDDLPELNDAMGMHLFTRDEPDGWSELGIDWMDTATMLERIDFVQSLAENLDSDYRWSSTAYRSAYGLTNADAIVDFFNDVLFEGTLSETTKSQVREFLTTDYNGNPASLTTQRIAETIGLLLSSPQWQFQ